MTGYIVKLSLKSKDNKLIKDLGYLGFKDNKLQNTYIRSEAYIYHSINLAEGGIGNYLNGLTNLGVTKDKIEMIVCAIEPG